MKGLTSGQIIVVIIDAGTTIPPIPRPAKTRSPQTTWRLSVRETARPPIPIPQLVFGFSKTFQRVDLKMLTRSHDY